VTEVLGRAGELDELGAWARTAAGGRRVVGLLRGEPGIGKSALLGELRRRLDTGAWSVLATTGKDADRELPFASLITLLRPVARELDTLAGDAADALRAACALGRGRADAIEVQLGVFRVVAALAERQPVALLVDDLDTIDGATARALEFALGRLDADPVLAVLAGGETTGAGLGAVADRALALGPLDAGTIAALLPASGVGASVRAELAARSGGNPLVAAELCAGLSDAQRRGDDPIPAVVRPRAALRRGFQQRLDGLDEAAQRALVVVAADDSGDAGAIVAALGLLGEPVSGLEAAEAAGVVTIGAGRVEFTHPLLRRAHRHGHGRGHGGRRRRRCRR
jgi:hypothetical protein